MPFQAATCPHCREAIQVPTDRDAVKCMYCGQSIDVKSVLGRQMGPNLENLFRLARTAAAGGNNEEAYRYFTQILEIDASNTEAWLGKALAAGWMSSLRDLRLHEVIHLSCEAVETAAPEERGTVAATAANQIAVLASAVWTMAAGHRNEFYNPEFPESNARLYADLKLQAATIFGALDAAINLVKAEGVTEHPIYLQYLGIARGYFTFGLGGDLDALVQKRVAEYLPEAQKIDPTVTAPEQKKSACFVATAVYGTQWHPDINLLRSFRDERLASSLFGRWFISVYYRLGPHAAGLVKRSRTLRLLTSLIVVRPLVHRLREQAARTSAYRNSQ